MKVSQRCLGCLLLLAVLMLSGCLKEPAVAPPGWKSAIALPSPPAIWSPTGATLFTEAEKASLKKAEPLPVATPQVSNATETANKIPPMTKEELDKWARQWSYLSFKEVSGEKVGRLLNLITLEEFDQAHEGDIFEERVHLASLKPSEACFASGDARACIGYQEAKVMVLLDEDLGPYSWPLAKPELRDGSVDSGNFAYFITRPCYYLFRDRDNTFHPVETGQGPDRYAYLNLSFYFNSKGSDIVIGVCLDEQGKEWRRWGFDTDPQVQSAVKEAREGDTVGVPTNRWIAFAIDFERDLGLTPGTPIYGIQFLCLEKMVVVDYVNLSQEFQDSTYPVSGE